MNTTNITQTISPTLVSCWQNTSFDVITSVLLVYSGLMTLLVIILVMIIKHNFRNIENGTKF